MFSYRKRQFLLTLCLITLFKHKYILSPVEALNGVIWSKNASDFVRIFSIESFEKLNQERFLISRELEDHDFNGTQLTLASYPLQNLINFYSNDTSVTGFEGDVWTLLSEMLNFKLRCIKHNELKLGTRSENGSWDGLLGYMYRNETDIIPRCVIVESRKAVMDFTFPMWMTRYRFYMKKQPQYHNITWMAELFSQRLWYSIIGLFFAVTLASFSTHALNSGDKKSRDSVLGLRDHFFYMFSIFCNQGWAPRQLEKHSKILLISIRIFSWLLIIAFSSTLTSHTAQRGTSPPFKDLYSFYRDTDYKLLIKSNSLVYSVFQSSPKPIYKTIINAGRVVRVDALEAYEKLCTGKHVYLESQDLVEARIAGAPCEVKVFGKPYFSTWIAAGVSRGFKYRKSMDLGMLRLFEVGITQRLKSKWVRKTKELKVPSAFESIGLEQVSLIFAMLGLAAVLSLVILLIENI